MTEEAFEATFVVQVDAALAWRRLTETPAGPERPDHVWLPGFDSSATVVDAEPPRCLRVTKDDEPCAGTDVVVTLEDAGSGTRIHVVQSRFGDWLPAPRDLMDIGWKYIIADLRTYLSTGVHARRFFRLWGDLGASMSEVDGGLRVEDVRAGGLAATLGLNDGDLLVELGGAPVTSLDDLVTILQLAAAFQPASAAWVRSGSLMTTMVTA